MAQRKPLTCVFVREEREVVRGGQSPPVVRLTHAQDLKVRPGETVRLSARGYSDPDGGGPVYRWWQSHEVGSYDGTVEIRDAGGPEASFAVPCDAANGETIHVIVEVTDTRPPRLTR